MRLDNRRKSIIIIQKIQKNYRDKINNNNNNAVCFSDGSKLVLVVLSLGNQPPHLLGGGGGRARKYDGTWCDTTYTVRTEVLEHVSSTTGASMAVPEETTGLRLWTRPDDGSTGSRRVYDENDGYCRYWRSRVVVERCLFCFFFSDGGRIHRVVCYTRTAKSLSLASNHRVWPSLRKFGREKKQNTTTFQLYRVFSHAYTIYLPPIGRIREQ